MDLTYNIFSLFDILSLIQGLILGTVLLILSKNKSKSSFFLGILLILYSLKLISFILLDLNIFDYYPELYGLPFNFFWIIYAIFYIYTQKISIYEGHKIKYWLLYPGILSYTIQLFIFFQSYEVKIDIFKSDLFNILIVSGGFYGWVIAMWNLKLLKKHLREVQNSFSRVENKELKWASVFIIFSIIGSFISILGYYYFDNNAYIKIFYTVFNLSVIYWLSYHGITQRNVISILTNQTKYDDNLNFNKGTDEKPLNNEMKELVKKIDNHMTASESFIHSELTIVDLAKAIQVHPRKISQTINTVRNENFNTYVNNFRIKKAEELFKNKELTHLSIEGIGNEVGFHSKSAFYSAFKKVTGTTPTSYKAQHVA